MVLLFVVLFQESYEVTYIAVAASEPKPAKEVPNTNKAIKSLLESEFGPGHVMVEVARCESGFRQFQANGEVLFSYFGTPDAGVYQINEYYHLSQATKMGIDIYTVEGNIRYAKYLYRTHGLQPWSASKKCWMSHIANK